MTFILQVDLHFVHVWGIEFVLNVATMLIVSHFSPAQHHFEPTHPAEPAEPGIVSLIEWKYARSLGAVLVVLAIGIYLWLGQAGR